MLTLLFDIDGTLIRSGGAGKAAMEGALSEVFGVEQILDVVPYSGRTDRSIARDLLTVHQITATEENERRLNAAYLERLPAALQRNGGVICPGIPQLLEILQRHPRVRLGLLTGNVRLGAQRKLEHFDLWNPFGGRGGFGDDHYDRDDVARMALNAFDPMDGPVWVIGDTPLDVRCARAIQAKALAVATGWHPLTELQECGADLTLPDLAQTDQLLEYWGLER
jgi:phosphoglycolate phosphatase-like HAD superfamily hydrolase